MVSSSCFVSQLSNRLRAEKLFNHRGSDGGNPGGVKVVFHVGSLFHSHQSGSQSGSRSYKLNGSLSIRAQSRESRGEKFRQMTSGSALEDGGTGHRVYPEL